MKRSFILFFLITIFVLRQGNAQRIISGLKMPKNSNQKISVIPADSLVFYKDLRKKLSKIFDIDQGQRDALDSLEQEFGPSSSKVDSILTRMKIQDSINEIEVVEILEKYGWVSQKKVGEKASAAIFIVIQHSALKTQIKYLPLMRKSVESGGAKANYLALLEDRVAIRTGKKQIYGSQVITNKEGKASVEPIQDEKNVDKRRARVGLGPLKDYLKQFGININ